MFVQLCLSLVVAYVAPPLSPHSAPGVQPNHLAPSRSLPLSMGVRLNNYMLDTPLSAAGSTVLVKLRATKEDTSKGGLVLAASLRKIRDGVVISSGKGAKHPQSGKLLPNAIEVGDHVVMEELEMEGERVTYDGTAHRILPASRVIAKLEGGVMSMQTFKPLGDRLLVKLPAPAEQTMSGILLAGLEEGQVPSQGIVLAAGPGTMNSNAEFNAMPAGVGDFVIFGKYSGADIDFEDGTKYKVVSASECLGKFSE
eukprot:scaffold27486_cov31-Tisochrysis_lutea.AAC.2